MSGLPEHANVVVIGAGIVGNCVTYHLARLGWKDIVLLDKGPLPNPGGSTGHASNFIFLTDHSKEMTWLTLDSVRQYKELGVFTESGGIEVARTAERMQELTRRLASSKAWGIVRAPPDLLRARGDPVDRRGRVVADTAPAHERGLRSSWPPDLSRGTDLPDGNRFRDSTAAAPARRIPMSSQCRQVRSPFPPGHVAHPATPCHSFATSPLTRPAPGAPAQRW